MSQNPNHFVLPGDVISNGSSSLKQNVILEGDKLVSTTIGFTEINDGAVDVIALTGLYISAIFFGAVFVYCISFFRPKNVPYTKNKCTSTCY